MGIRQPQGPLGTAHHWPKTLASQSHPSGFSTHVLLISSFPTVLVLPSLLSQGLALPSMFLPTPLPPHPTNLFAVCGHEVEAAGGDGQSDWHSSKFQVTPPQNGAEWTATGLGKGPRVSEAGGSPTPGNPHTPAFRTSPHLPHTSLPPAPPHLPSSLAPEVPGATSSPNPSFSALLISFSCCCSR